MEYKEIFLYKVLLGVTLTPLEVTMDVIKSRATESTNSYLITEMELVKGKMEPIPSHKIITKKNIMIISASFGHTHNISYSTICFENQISEAKALCMQSMELALKRDVENAIAMKEEFQQWKSNLK